MAVIKIYLTLLYFLPWLRKGQVACDQFRSRPPLLLHSGISEALRVQFFAMPFREHRINVSPSQSVVNLRVPIIERS